MALGSSLLHAALGRSAPRVSASAFGAMWELLVGVLVTMSPYVAQLRAAMGSAVLLLPSTAVLPVDTSGRLLLVQHRGHGDGWGTVGGAVEIGESPRQAALRETHEEIGALPRNLSLLDVLGGPDFEVAYPNGDRAAYVTSVFTADLGSQDPETGWRGDRRDRVVLTRGSHRRPSQPFHTRCLGKRRAPVAAERGGVPAAVVSNRTDVIDHSHCGLGAIRTRCPKAGHWVVVLP